MNGKQAKKLRKCGKIFDANPSQVVYNEGRPPIFMTFAYNSQGELIPSTEGDVYRKVSSGIPRTLSICGRKDYKNFKRDFKNMWG